MPVGSNERGQEKKKRKIRIKGAKFSNSNQLSKKKQIHNEHEMNIKLVVKKKSK